jgi:hypothetical protein
MSRLGLPVTQVELVVEGDVRIDQGEVGERLQEVRRPVVGLSRCRSGAGFVFRGRLQGMSLR